VGLARSLLIDTVVVPTVADIQRHPAGRDFAAGASRVAPVSYDVDADRLEFEIEGDSASGDLLATVERVGRSAGWKGPVGVKGERAVVLDKTLPLTGEGLKVEYQATLSERSPRHVHVVIARGRLLGAPRD
jgi:hypothetical protein